MVAMAFGVGTIGGPPRSVRLLEVKLGGDRVHRGRLPRVARFSEVKFRGAEPDWEAREFWIASLIPTETLKARSYLTWAPGPG